MWNHKIDTRLTYSLDRIPQLKNLYECFIYQKNDRSLSLFKALSLCAYLLEIIRPESRWKQRLKEHINTFDYGIAPQKMGFPNEWENLELWK